MTDAERLTERVEALERKVAKFRRASIFVGCVAISFGGPMIYLERGLATAVVLGVATFAGIVWLNKEPGYAWWEPPA